MITTNDFVGKFAIGQFSLNETLLQWYIDNYEKRFFDKFFSDGYYSDLSDRLASQDVDIKAQAEKELAEIKFALVAFVWIEYTSNEQEKLTGAGITIQDETNARTINSDVKCIKVYNEMVSELKRCKNPHIQQKRLRYFNCLGL